MAGREDIKRQVMSRYKHGELRSPDGHLVTNKRQAIRIAISMQQRQAPERQQTFDFLSAVTEPTDAQAHHLNFVGVRGEHVPERWYICRRCRVQMFEVGRGGKQRQLWGESRETTAPRCWEAT